MAHCFLDTCVVKYRYIKNPQFRAHRQKINRLIGNRNNTTYIADATILEIASALGGYCRENRGSLAEYDAMDHEFMQDIADGRFIVRPANKRLYVLRARNLLRLGGVIHRRGLGSTDALIASCALDLAYELKERVRFFTSDQKLNGVLPLIDAFSANMELNFIPAPPPAPATPATPPGP
jgi:hypothetical protein